MNFKIPTISNLNLAHKRVFVRADLNVPLNGKEIVQDYRLQRILPTIEHIKKNGGKVILATHIGRPKPMTNTHICDPNFSTNILVPWFKSHGYAIKQIVDLKRAELLSRQDFGTILLLENLRCFAGEQQTSITFAQLLAQCADVYINDAFGAIHRNDTSITLLPQQFLSDTRAFGLLVEHEIKNLEALKKYPEQPFIMVMGGSKIADKIPVIEQFFIQPQKHRVQKILIGGAVANAFLQAQGIGIGGDVVDKKTEECAKKIMLQAKENNVEILLPIDRVCTKPTFENPAQFFEVGKIPENYLSVDIGLKTIDLFCKEIAHAKTIFVNGTMGMYEKELYTAGSKKILDAVAQNTGVTIIGGGDAVAATYLFGLENKMTFLSTGGGATLEFLGTQNVDKLPGITAILSK